MRLLALSLVVALGVGGTFWASITTTAALDIPVESSPGSTTKAIYEAVPGFAPADPSSIDPIKLGQKVRELNQLPPMTDVLRERFPKRFQIAESSCGSDTRVPVPDASVFPFSANCYLKIEYGDGEETFGTGWLVGPKTVITAGHNVHWGGAEYEFYESVVVIPAYDANDPEPMPFGSQKSTRLRASVGWKRNGNVAADYGAVLLRHEFANDKGARPGFYGIAVPTDQGLEQLPVNISGYTDDLLTGVQYYSGGPVLFVTSRQLRYTIDTAGGMSGSALVRHLTNGQRQAVGIHGYGGCPNDAVRITKQVSQDILDWREEGQ